MLAEFLVFCWFDSGGCVFDFVGLTRSEIVADDKINFILIGGAPEPVYDISIKGHIFERSSLPQVLPIGRNSVPNKARRVFTLWGGHFKQVAALGQVRHGKYQLATWSYPVIGLNDLAFEVQNFQLDF